MHYKAGQKSREVEENTRLDLIHCFDHEKALAASGNFRLIGENRQYTSCIHYSHDR